jgi:hypothetical protein
VTVIATGFDAKPMTREKTVIDFKSFASDDNLDIPAFLRKR